MRKTKRAPVYQSEPVQSQRFVVLSDFFTRRQQLTLLKHALDREGDFEKSKVGRYDHRRGVVDRRFRRSRVLFDLGRFRDLVTRRLLRELTAVVETLGMQPFRVSRVATQITASNEADFFKRHTDSSLHEGRVVSFVYYFYREPKAFTGGELRVYDTRVEGDRIVGGRKYDTIIPRQNQMLFFPSYLFHEVLPVRCPSQRLADSRFTVNGWISRK